jgi:hypothetical protein
VSSWPPGARFRRRSRARRSRAKRVGATRSLS